MICNLRGCRRGTQVRAVLAFIPEMMRATLLLAVLACACEAWRAPAASAHATARPSPRSPPLTPRRSALVMSEDGPEVAEVEAEAEAAVPPPSTVRFLVVRDATVALTLALALTLTLTLTLTVTLTQAPAKGSGQGGMPSNFLGFLDVNTGAGSLAASLIVAGGQG